MYSEIKGVKSVTVTKTKNPEFPYKTEYEGIDESGELISGIIESKEVPEFVPEDTPVLRQVSLQEQLDAQAEMIEMLMLGGF